MICTLRVENKRQAGLGEIVSTAIPGVEMITFVYVRDPEGNIIELQQSRY